MYFFTDDFGFIAIKSHLTICCVTFTNVIQPTQCNSRLLSYILNIKKKDKALLVKGVFSFNVNSTNCIFFFKKD